MPFEMLVKPPWPSSCMDEAKEGSGWTCAWLCPALQMPVGLYLSLWLILLISYT